ncbi:hypothetical protein ACLMJK_007213 [Lecanora helva]
MEASTVDVAVIGAGLAGIAFARFYLDTHPDSNLVVLEKDGHIGGVWSAARVFDDFWVQSPLRMTSFSDVVLEIPKGAPNLHDTFEAKYVTEYLENYVDNHVYNGRSLRSRIQLNAAVHRAEKSRSGWILHFEGPTLKTLQCKMLAVAAGLTSSPVMPDISPSPAWSAPVLHHRDFGPNSSAILASSSPYKYITVLGGGKSAADMVYTAIKAKKKVNWIIRKSGEGPGIFMNPAASGRYKNNAEAGATQKATFLIPSGFRAMPDWALNLHQYESKRGDLESKLFAADNRYKAWANYRGREDALPGFRELEPKASFFWNSGPVGMIQHDDFWDLVSQEVNIYRSDRFNTKADALVLDDGTEVTTDIVLCGTGWKSAYTFLSSEQICDLGLPHDPSEDSEEERQSWGSSMKSADRSILEQYPILGDPPDHCKQIGRSNLTPARLYNGIAPLRDGTILFLGRARVSNNFLGAEAQAIWATAYWDKHVIIPPFEQAQREVAYMNAFSRRRYPSRGVDGINFHTDLMWYTDHLVNDAGLTSHRKEWWEDPEAPCLASDFKDCKDEYIAKYSAEKIK